MRKPRLLLTPALLCFLLTGCMSQIPSLRDWADETIGLPVTVLQEIEARPESQASREGWKSKRYDLPNGNWVYVTPDRNDCEVHFEVDKAGIMIGYQLVGEGCRYQ